MEAWLHSLLAALALPQYGLSTVFVVAMLSATLLPMGSEPVVFGLVKLDPALFWPAVLVAGHTRPLAREADLMATSRLMTPTEVGNWLLEFGEKPIAVPVAHHPQAVSVRNDDWIGYRTGPVVRLRMNAMVGDGSTALVARSSRTVAPPSRGSVYLYRVNRRQANPAPVSAELIRYALSRQGQQLALERGYVPLSFEEIRRVTSQRPASER